MKKRLLFSVLLVTFLSFEGYAQIVWSVKAGGGTSWVIFPKVFLVDSIDVNNVWEIGPSANSGTFNVAGDAIIPIGNHWFAATGLSFNYISGKIKVSSVALETSSSRLQNYVRLEVPLLVGIKSSDDFWVTFGPSIFFNVADNEGLKNAIADLANDVSNVNTKRTIGVKAHLGLSFALTEKLFFEASFDSDLGRKFDYENDTYEIRLSMQSITLGFGWALNR